MAQRWLVASPAARRPALAVASLLAVAMLCGCGGDDEGTGSSDGTPSSSASDVGSHAGSDVEALIAAGLEQVAVEDFDAARGTFSSVLTLEPGNVYASYNLGYIAQRRGQVEEARARYQDALAAQDDFAPALYNLALLTEGDDLDAAIALYRRVVEAQPDDAATLMRLGFALQHQGRREEGQRFLDQGIAVDPAMADVDSPTYD